jgi:hypothetical protein
MSNVHEIPDVEESGDNMIVDIRNTTYHYFYNLYFDGGSADIADPTDAVVQVAIYANDTGDHIKAFNCHFQNVTRACLSLNLVEDNTCISVGYSFAYTCLKVNRNIIIGCVYPIFNSWFKNRNLVKYN